MNIVTQMFEAAPVTNVAAVGAVTSPLWLPGLQDISTGAATILPILGCIWFAIQIVGYLLKKGR